MSDTTSKRSVPLDGGKRKLRNYMLNREVQLPYLAFVAITSAIITGVLGYTIWYQANWATSEVTKSLEAFGDAGLAEEVASQLSSGDTSLLWMMVLVGLGLMLILSLYMVVMTHHVAGPLHKISLYLDRMRDGRLPQVYDLRKGDQFVSFFEKFKGMEQSVIERTQRDVEALERFVEACEQLSTPLSRELEHKVDELRSLAAKKRKALEDRPVRLVSNPPVPTN